MIHFRHLYDSGDTIFIPAAFVAFTGHALDEKTPLLRASDAMSREGARLLNLLGFKGIKGVQANIGLEQEFFFVPRDAYLKVLKPYYPTLPYTSLTPVCIQYPTFLHLTQ